MRHDFHKLNRLPPYVFAEVISLMTAARKRGEDVIDLGMGNPDLATPTHVVDKICEAARNPRNHRYSASKGLPNLRAAITEYWWIGYAGSGHSTTSPGPIAISTKCARPSFEPITAIASRSGSSDTAWRR